MSTLIDILGTFNEHPREFEAGHGRECVSPSGERNFRENELFKKHTIHGAKQ